MASEPLALREYEQDQEVCPRLNKKNFNSSKQSTAGAIHFLRRISIIYKLHIFECQSIEGTGQ